MPSREKEAWICDFEFDICQQIERGTGFCYLHAGTRLVIAGLTRAGDERITDSGDEYSPARPTEVSFMDGELHARMGGEFPAVLFVHGDDATVSGVSEQRVRGG